MERVHGERRFEQGAPSGPSLPSASGHLAGFGGANAAIIETMDVAMPQSPILVLDDDPDVGLSAQLLLQRRLAPVFCIRRTVELYGALERLQPALLLLDLNFAPGRTDGEQGLRLLDEIRATPAPPVVVVLTAYANIDLAVRAVKRGAYDFVTKPWDNVRLIALCREALEHARRTSTVSTPGPQDAARLAPLQPLAEQERAAVLRAMADAQGNLSAAARTLGLSRAALYRRLQKHGL